MIPRTAQPLAMWRAIGAAEARTARIRDAVTRDGDPHTACQNAIDAIVDIAVLAGVDLGWDDATILAGRYADALEREVARAVELDELRGQRDELRDVVDTLIATVEDVEQELDAALRERDDARSTADEYGDRNARLEDTLRLLTLDEHIDESAGILTCLHCDAEQPSWDDSRHAADCVWVDARQLLASIAAGEFGEVPS